MSTLILLLLVLVLIYKKRTWWIIGICIFIYGIFDFLFISFYQPGSGTLEFTSTLNTFIFGGYTGNPLRHIIHLFPFAFYAVSLIVFLTKPIRRQYHIIE